MRYSERMASYPCSAAPATLKRLIIGTAVLKELKTLPRKSVKRLFSSPHIKKIRCASSLQQITGLNRNCGHTCKTMTQSARNRRSVRQTSSIVKFLIRSDNSTCLPGKKDVIIVGKKKEQKYVLTDYLHLLHRKYIQENASSEAIGLSFFK